MMKKKILLFLYLIISLSVYSQTQMKTYFDPYYKTKLKKVYHVKLNTPILNGNYKEYDEYGYLLINCNFINNIKQGKSTTYYGAHEASLFSDDEIKQHLGKISGIYNYKNGILDGYQVSFRYDSSGKKFKYREYNYKNDLEASYTEYYSNGNIKIKTQPNGECFINYENGNKLETYTLKDKEYNGLYTSYFSNGNKLVAGEYNNGLKVGTWNEYYENGTLKSEETYEGKLVVNQIINYPNGDLKLELKKINEHSIIEKSYDSITKTLILIQEFKIEGDSKLADGEKKTYYRSGKLKEIQEFKKGKQSGLNKVYYSNGNLKENINIQNGEINGLQKSYFENGNLKYSAETKQGSLFGIVKVYDENKNLLSVTNYIDDIRTGEQKRYFKNGNIKSKGNFNSEGKKIEEWFYYNENGTLNYIDDIHPYTFLKTTKTGDDIKKEQIEYLSIEFSKRKRNVEKVYSIIDTPLWSLEAEKENVYEKYRKSKKHLYNAYLIYKTDIENRVSLSTTLDDKKVVLKEGVELTKKMIELKDINTKEIEKKLKKENNISAIKSTLEL